MKIVTNTSPIIFLAQLERISLLSKHTVYIPEQVISELKRGKQEDHPDYDAILRAVELIDARIEPVQPLAGLPENLGEGEKAAISLAIKKKVSYILIDEARGRKIARLCGLKPRGTMGVIIEEYRSGRITRKECKNLIFRLMGCGYRISEDILIKIFEEFG